MLHQRNKILVCAGTSAFYDISDLQKAIKFTNACDHRPIKLPIQAKGGRNVTVYGMQAQSKGVECHYLQRLNPVQKKKKASKLINWFLRPTHWPTSKVCLLVFKMRPRSTCCTLLCFPRQPLSTSAAACKHKSAKDSTFRHQCDARHQQQKACA